MVLTRSQTSNQTRAPAPVKMATSIYNLRPLPSRLGSSASVPVRTGTVRTIRVSHGYNLRPRH